MHCSANKYARVCFNECQRKTAGYVQKLDINSLVSVIKFFVSHLDALQATGNMSFMPENSGLEHSTTVEVIYHV